jgi:ribosomal protein S18 acetylase RimI-like enzyme
MPRARPANIDDVPELASLMLEFYAEAGFTLARAAAERTFTALLAAPELGGVWLLESDGRSAGFVVLTVSFSMEYGGLRGFVDDFFVKSAFRRRGLGAAALAEVRRTCQERGVRALLVEVGPSNADALRVYRRAGFADTGHTLLTLPLAGPVHAAGPGDDSER